MFQLKQRKQIPHHLFLFYSGTQHIRWCPVALVKLMFFTNANIIQRRPQRHIQERLLGMYHGLKDSILYINQLFSNWSGKCNLNQNKDKEEHKIILKKSGRLLCSKVVRNLQKDIDREIDQWKRSSTKRLTCQRIQLKRNGCQWEKNANWIICMEKIYFHLHITPYKDQFQMDSNLNVRDKTMDLLQAITRGNRKSSWFMVSKIVLNKKNINNWEIIKISNASASKICHL